MDRQLQGLMTSASLPERCELCPYFTQTFIQELKRRTPSGLQNVPVLTGLCAVMRHPEVKQSVPKYEITHRRAMDSRCYFENASPTLRSLVSWLIERHRKS
jgi:hypothetical protein